MITTETESSIKLQLKDDSRFELGLDASRKAVIDVSNSYGTATIDKPGYGTEIPDEFSPPSPWHY
jgi:hypothetical protein